MLENEPEAPLSCIHQLQRFCSIDTGNNNIIDDVLIEANKVIEQLPYNGVFYFNLNLESKN